MPTVQQEPPSAISLSLSRNTERMVVSPKKEAVTNKSWAHLVAGAGAGIATAVLTSPLDVLRTRLQSDFYRPQLSSNRSYSTHPFHSSAGHIRETFQILISIGRNEGWRGLFRGLGPGLAGVAPATAIKLYTYGNCKRLFSEMLELDKNSAIVHAAAATSAGIVTGTATNPIWLVKTRLQLDKSRADKARSVNSRQYKNSFDCFKQVLQKEGIMGLYRGLSASYLGAAETALHLTLYEQMKMLLVLDRKAKRQEESAWDQIHDWLRTSTAAGASKLLTVLVAYPHEVVRTRLRQAPMENGLLKYSGLVQCSRLILKEEGVAAMYGGLTAHLLRSIPSAAISLGVYELVLRFL